MMPAVSASNPQHTMNIRLQAALINQKNLGAKTSHLAAAMTTYDPDPTWKPASAGGPSN
jgi:hypothetical protein